MVDRFFLPRGFDASQKVILLDAEEREHATAVRRVRPGEGIELVDGSGCVAAGRVLVATRHEVRIEIERLDRRNREGTPVHLAVCAPRGPRMDALVDGATQLGVLSIRPIVTERTVSVRADLSPARLARWNRIAREAAKQSGEPFVPEIHPPLSFEEFCVTPFEGLRLLLDPSPESPALASILEPNGQPVRLLVGPEGGLTTTEVGEAVAHGDVKVRLGRAILRIEVASLAAVALVRFGVRAP